jgi:hypothetical protein
MGWQINADVLIIASNWSDMDLRRKLLQHLSCRPESKSQAQTSAIEQATPEHQEWASQFEPVQIVPQFHLDEIQEEALLFRYVDLPKLLDLIVNQQLVLPKLRALTHGDPFECNARPDYSSLTRQQLIERLDILKRTEPHLVPVSKPLPWSFIPAPDGVQQWTRSELDDAVWFLERAAALGNVACCCWYASDVESDAMWRLYCGEVGAAIVTSVSSLRSSIQCHVPRLFSSGFQLTVAKIRYTDLYGFRKVLRYTAMVD